MPGRDEDTRRGHRYDAIVVGGGSIGLSIAWQAARAGLAVAVVDPDPGRGASWVAAGMLAPVSEVHYGEEALLALNLASARRWPTFAAELEASVGRKVGYRQCGTMVVALDDDDRAWTAQLFAFQQELGLDVEWLTGRRARGCEPNLSPHVRAAMLAAGDHQVDNRLLVAALLEAVAGAGCDLHRRFARSLETTAGSVAGVRLDDGTLVRARAVVLAAGARSPELSGLPPGAAPPVRPVKGQILRLRTPPGLSLLGRSVRAVVHGATMYLVPRADGTVVVGSTVEEKGFDTSVTAGAVYELLRDAHRVVPGTRELELVEAIAGLRPGSPDNAPIIGPASPGTVRGLVVATGHYRNGILLTPLTAEAVAAVLQGKEPPDEVVPFSPARFRSAVQDTGAADPPGASFHDAP